MGEKSTLKTLFSNKSFLLRVRVLALPAKLKSGASAGPSTVKAHGVRLTLRALDLPRLRLDRFNLRGGIDHPATNFSLSRSLGNLDPVAAADRVGLADPRHADDAGRNPYFEGFAHLLSRSQIYKKHANPTINSNILILRFLGHAERVYSRRSIVHCHAGNL